MAVSVTKKAVAIAILLTNNTNASNSILANTVDDVARAADAAFKHFMSVWRERSRILLAEALVLMHDNSLGC